MKIVIAGRGRLAVRGAHLFSLLVSMRPGAAELVCAVSDDGSEDWRPSLRRAAGINGWRSYERISDIGLGPADLFLSLQHPTIIRMSELGGARAVNLHFAMLPRNRGSLSCYWPIAGRERTAGVALHELTRGVDAGPIIATRNFPLPVFTSAGQLFEMYHDHAFELLAMHARALLDGTYTARPQLDPGVRAHRRGDVDFSRVEVTDFTRPAAVIRAECLAMIFPGFQLPTFRGQPVRNAYLLPPGTAPANGHGVGTVLAQTKQAAVVSCADGLICFEYAER